MVLRIARERVDHTEQGLRLENLVPALHGMRRRLDLAATTSGGVAIACSDEFFSSPSNLIAVGDARDMADGWETRRRRDEGFDWATFRLAAGGVVERVEIDTTHFKGNHPDRCAVDALCRPGLEPAAVAELPDDAWTVLVEPTTMQPHARHALAVTAAQPASHVRLRVLPDGGVARLRVFGVVTEEGWCLAGLAMLNALPVEAAETALLACCGSTVWMRTMVARRPFADVAAVLDTADEAWRDLTPADWREAFAAHPRIGERAGGWSGAEQAGARDATSGTLAALADGNRAYEERFGHVILFRSRYIAPAAHSARFYREYFRPAAERVERVVPERVGVVRRHDHDDRPRPLGGRLDRRPRRAVRARWPAPPSTARDPP